MVKYATDGLFLSAFEGFAESKCTSGRLSVCPDFLTLFLVSDHHEIARVDATWKK